MSQIRQFKDPQTSADIYPATVTDAVYTESGGRLTSVLHNPNLLDNGWFTVNQRNSASGTYTSGYSVDRWKHSRGSSVTIDSNGLSITSSASTKANISYADDKIYSIIKGKTATLSILLQNGTVISSSFAVPSTYTEWGTIKTVQTDSIEYGINFGTGSAEHIWVWIDAPLSKTVAIRAVKLEVGSISTLANDHAPDYQLELLKCYRYYRKLFFYARPETIRAKANYVTYHTDVSMRATPSVVSHSVTVYNSVTGSTGVAVGSVTVAMKNDSCIRFAVNLASSATAITDGSITMNVELSADI